MAEKTNPKIFEATRALRSGKKPLFKSLSKSLSVATRRRAEVNVSKLENLCKPGDAVAVPGKVMGTGEITKAVNVYALSFSGQAKLKIEKAKGKCLSLAELAKSGKIARIIK